MKLARRLVLIAFLILFSTGCAYLNIRDTLDTDVSKTVLGAKQGKSSSHSVAWLVAWGDSGTHAAAENGGIKTINHLDVEYFSILFGLYSRRSTIAYGD
jgi:hypothetical protein